MSGNKLPGISSVGTNAASSPNYMNHGLPQTSIGQGGPTNISNVPHSAKAVRNHTNTMQNLQSTLQQENRSLQNENQALRNLVNAYQEDQNRSRRLPTPRGTNSSSSSNSSNDSE